MVNRLLPIELAGHLLFVDYTPAHSFEPTKLNNPIFGTSILASARKLLEDRCAFSCRQLAREGLTPVALGRGGVRVLDLLIHLWSTPIHYASFRISRGARGSPSKYCLAGDILPNGPLLLVDDVICTGGTLAAVQGCLRPGQSASVFAPVMSGNRTSGAYHILNISRFSAVDVLLVFKNLEPQYDKENAYYWPGIFNIQEVREKSVDMSFLQYFADVYGDGDKWQAKKYIEDLLLGIS